MKTSSALTDADVNDFQLSLMQFKIENNCEDYFSALVQYMEENDLDAEDIAKMISPTLYDLIKADALDKNLLTDTQNKNIVMTEELFD